MGNLFLKRVRRLCGVESSLLNGELVQRDLVAVLIAVLHCPISVDAVGAVVIGLVYLRLHPGSLHGEGPLFGPRVVSDALRGRCGKGGEQSRLTLLDIFHSREFRNAILLNRDVVGQRIIDTFLQGPLTGRSMQGEQREARHKERGRCFVHQKH